MASGAGAAEAVARCMAAAPYADFSLHVRLNLLIYDFFSNPDPLSRARVFASGK